MRPLADVLAYVDDAGAFLESVTSVNTERYGGETPLHLVAKWGDAEAIRILVAHGARIDKAGEDGNTPLHYAAMLNQFDASKTLIELGAKCCQDVYGNTPSQLANDEELVDLLREHGF